jgi:hypothetical protein
MPQSVNCQSHQSPYDEETTNYYMSYLYADKLKVAN